MKATGFARLDAAINGFDDRTTAVLYGPPGTGKTVFCLSFLWQGLESGESVAMVTAQKPGELLHVAGIHGWDMKPHLQTRQLRIFEYPDEIQETASAAADPSQAITEFRDLLGTAQVGRVVFDPVTPLMESKGRVSIQRCRGILHPITRLGAATLVVVDEKKADQVMPYCKDLTGCVLRFAPPARTGGARYLRLERYRDKPEAEGLYPFELRAGKGLVEVAEAVAAGRGGVSAPVRPRKEAGPVPASRITPVSRVAAPGSAWPGARLRTPSEELKVWQGPRQPVPQQQQQQQPALQQRNVLATGSEGGDRVLLIDPDTHFRTSLRSELQRGFVVLEACGSMDAGTLLAAGAPSAIVMALDLEGESGIELICRLRQSGWNLPIVTVSRARTVNDHLSALAAGADVCLGQPVDGRILRLTVFNALCRSRGARRLEAPKPAPAPFQQSASAARFARVVDESGSAIDLAALHAALTREAAYSREQDSPFVVVAMRIHADTARVEALANRVHSLLRASDTIFVGTHGVACLLADTQSPDPFLAAFWKEWGAEPLPQVNWMRFEGQEGFVETAGSRVADEIGGLAEPQWLAATAAAAGEGADSGGPATNSYPVPISPEVLAADTRRTYTMTKIEYSHE